jgi:NADH:ubiquinone oxidoreductase subunit 6 (subunit J)
MARLDLGGVAFAALALLTLGSAGVVAFARNVMHSAVALLGTLAGVAGLYVMLSADFLAAVQILIYVGGTLILFLFAAMLTARIDEASQSNAPRARRGAFFAALLLGVPILSVALRTAWPVAESSALTSVPSTAKLGHALLGEYVFPFELASVVLVAAMVGAVALARRAVKLGAAE